MGILKKLLRIQKIDSPYWEAFCYTCFWQGSSINAHGFKQIADTGDYADGYCPVCGSDIDEHNSEYYNIFYLLIHFTIGKIRAFINIQWNYYQNKKWCKAFDKKHGDDWEMI